MDRPASPIAALSRRTALIGAAQALAMLVAACSALPVPPATPATGSPSPSPVPPQPTATSLAEPIALPTEGAGCAGRLAAVIPPTPIPYPGYTEREPSTGLHVTAPPLTVNMATYRLKVTGKVAHELSLTYDELRCLPKIRAYSRIECPGFFVDWSNLAGASLVSVLELAGPAIGAGQVHFTGADGRTSAISLVDAQASQYFLAYEWEGEALPASHGFPVRVALLDNAGGGWVKWLQEIAVS